MFIVLHFTLNNKDANNGARGVLVFNFTLVLKHYGAMGVYSVALFTTFKE